MSTPTAQISQWLADFGAAVSRGEFGKATSMFGDDSYWRDLVSFTWNLKTAEGPQQIQAMLEATMPNAKPSNFAIQGEGSEANGVTEGWFTFETATGRGRGHLRLIGGKAWTLLTTLQELKGFEEKKRENRPKGVEHGAFKDRKSWLEARQDEERTLGFAKQPYVVVIGGGQAGIILGARLKKLGVPAIIVEKNPTRRRQLAQPLQEPVPARPGVVRPTAVPAVPRRLAGVQPEGQDRRLARELHQADGAQLLVRHRMQERALGRCPAGVATSPCSTRARA